MNDALTLLVNALESQGRPPLSWVMEHAPGGDLGPVWRTCTDPVALIYLVQRNEGPTRAAAVLAAVQREVRVPRPGPNHWVEFERDPSLWLAVGFKHPGEEPLLWEWDGYRPVRHAPEICVAIRERVPDPPALGTLLR